MPVDLNQYFVIGISSRALFDLTAEHHIFDTQGLEAYEQYQVEKEHDVLRPVPQGAHGRGQGTACAV